MKKERKKGAGEVGRLRGGFEDLDVTAKGRVGRAKGEKVEQGSGNVFADLGLPDPETALAKADLARQVCAAIADRGLTQAEAAKLLRLDQPKVSALMRGRLRGFSTERLFRLLNALDQEVEIVIRPARGSGRRAGVHVVSAS
jgi:predicted XRE-type DNA-binding protein